MFIAILLIIIIVLFVGFTFYAIAYGMDNKYSNCDEEMFPNSGVFLTVILCLNVDNPPLFIQQTIIFVQL